MYRETVEVKKEKWHVMMVGDGMGVTLIYGSRNYVDGYGTFHSATVGECYNEVKLYVTMHHALDA